RTGHDSVPHRDADAQARGSAPKRGTCPLPSTAHVVAIASTHLWHGAPYSVECQSTPLRSCSPRAPVYVSLVARNARGNGPRPVPGGLCARWRVPRGRDASARSSRPERHELAGLKAGIAVQQSTPASSSCALAPVKVCDARMDDEAGAAEVAVRSSDVDRNRQGKPRRVPRGAMAPVGTFSRCAVTKVTSRPLG